MNQSGWCCRMGRILLARDAMSETETCELRQV